MDGDTPVPSDGPGGEPYQSLYRRFRPGTFAEVRGQDHVVLALRNAVRDGRVAHAYLFNALARIRAVDVLPVPRGPLKR